MIRAKVPTVYQRDSIGYFGMPVKENRDGSFSAEMEFESKRQAKEYLIFRAQKYTSEHGGDINKLIDEITNHGYLSLDACTATIEEE